MLIYKNPEITRARLSITQKEEQAGRIMLSDFKLYYKAPVIKTLYQHKTESRNKFLPTWSTNIWLVHKSEQRVFGKLDLDIQFLIWISNNALDLSSTKYKNILILIIWLKTRHYKVCRRSDMKCWRCDAKQNTLCVSRRT